MHFLSIKITMKVVCLTPFPHAMKHCFNMLFDFLQWAFINHSSFLPYLPLENCKQLEQKKAFKHSAICLTLLWHSWSTKYTAGSSAVTVFSALPVCAFQCTVFLCCPWFEKSIFSTKFTVSMNLEFLDTISKLSASQPAFQLKSEGGDLLVATFSRVVQFWGE